MLKPIGFCLLFVSLLTGCALKKTPAPASVSLTQARSGFKTTLVPQNSSHDPVAQNRSGLFSIVQYPAPAGNLPAYLSHDPGDGKRHPAMIWITGGDCNSIGDVWTPAPPENDQTAAAYRDAGIVMLFPSLRGGNQNPGVKEGFLGEVDDVLAAAKYLESQNFVDPRRIYLGGHSTGGTLAMLVSECSARFRAVFSFGPVEDVSGYGPDSGFLPFDISNKQEVKLRSPGYWLSSIKSPVWVFEGTGGNIDSLQSMADSSTNPQVHFIAIEGATHFATLSPTNALIAKKILLDSGPVCNLSFTDSEVSRNFAR